VITCRTQRKMSESIPVSLMFPLWLLASCGEMSCAPGEHKDEVQEDSSAEVGHSFLGLTGQFLSTYVLMFHLIVGSCTPSFGKYFRLQGWTTSILRRSVSQRVHSCVEWAGLMLVGSPLGVEDVKSLLRMLRYHVGIRTSLHSSAARLDTRCLTPVCCRCIPSASVAADDLKLSG